MSRADANRRLLVRLAVVAVGMFGFGFALVPFYEQICRVTGINNLVGRDEVTNTQIDTTRTVTIEFDANTNHLPWSFRPLQSSLMVRPGEMAQVDYEVVNTRDRPVAGQAIPSYGPSQAGRYFKKIDCFCFTRQTLGAHESRRMPVVFVVDPELPKDVHTITLSYTFFEVAGATDQSAIVAPEEGRL